MIVLLLFLGALALFVYFMIIKPQKYWEEKGIVYVKPTFLFGNMTKTVLRQQSFSEMLKKLYDTFPDERYVGIYQFLLPSLLIKDPDLIKQITIKEFDVFPEHRTFISEEVEPYWGNNLFQMKVERWRDMRPTLSPAFTSSKMRAMLLLMSDCAEQLVGHFKKEGYKPSGYEFKDVFTRFTNDVIATTAFGVSCDSLAEPNNDFYNMGKEATDFTGFRCLKFFGYSISPFLMKLFKVKLFDEPIKVFFSTIILQTMKLREERGLIRPDLINILIEAKKGRVKHEEPNDILDTGFATVTESQLGKDSKRQTYQITDEDIIAQAFIFFLAGFDTASVLMCYMGYELAINPDVQKRLRDEVDKARKQCSGKITYEALLEMKYLDMVVSETLRKWPPQPLTDRRSVRPFVIEPQRPGEKRLVLEEGQVCIIPIFAIHRDPKHYPNPEKFDPERFSNENKDNIVPCTFVPFGSGPRNCIGSRFALLETKLLFFHILSNFEIVPVEKTPIPMVLSIKHFNLNAKDGFWLGLKPRK